MIGYEYFSAPKNCQSRSGGVINYTCKHHARKTGGSSVCLFNKKWERILAGYVCPDKEWQTARIDIDKK